MVQMCRDKNITSTFFISCGLHAPMPVSKWEDYHGCYPAFIKPKDGSSSINAYRVNEVSELRNRAEQICDYVIQPFIAGREYTIDICCDWEGEPVSIVPRERLQVRSGEVLITRIELDEKMINESRALCAKMKPIGPITVQLIRDTEGTDWFIEINPRFGGGAPLSMKAGARTAETILQMVDGDHVNRDWSIANHAIYSRFDQSVCVSQGQSAIRGVVFDLDDTLYSEKEYIRSGFKAVSNYLHGDFSDTLWHYFQIGKLPIDELLRDLNLEKEKHACMKVYREHMPVIHLYEGVHELIERLKASGVYVGIITDGRPEGQHKKLAALGLTELIGEENIIITDELGGIQFRKPCDIAFRIMMTKWQMQASEMIYIGDNLSKDFQAPRQLGFRTLWFQNKDGIHKNGCIMSSKESVQLLWRTLIRLEFCKLSDLSDL